MKLLLPIIPLLVLVFPSCDKHPDEMGSLESANDGIAFQWHDAKYSLDQYKRLYPDRPILAFFRHDWDIPITKKVIYDSDITDRLRERNYLGLIFESTEKDSLGVKEMKRLDHLSIPLLYVSIPDLDERPYEPTYSEAEVRKLMDEIIMQTGTDQPATVPGSRSEGEDKLQPESEDRSR